MAKRRIIVAADTQAMAAAAARLIVARARRAIAARGRFTLLLSGGNTVRPCYEALARARGIDWCKVYVFWGDERFVEHDNPYSNYALARAALLRHVRAHVVAVGVDAATPAQGARAYERTIRDFFGIGKDRWPRFDLAINGMGGDGHTASMFPGNRTARIRNRLVASAHARLHPWVDRITLTLPVFNHARCVLFMAAGAGKAVTLRRVLAHERGLPAGAVRPSNGELIWVIDRAIAAGLDR